MKATLRILRAHRNKLDLGKPLSPLSKILKPSDPEFKILAGKTSGCAPALNESVLPRASYKLQSSMHELTILSTLHPSPREWLGDVGVQTEAWSGSCRDMRNAPDTFVHHVRTDC